MAVSIAVLKETKSGESRVSAIPETVKKLINLGCDVTVVKGAGEAASYQDNTYKDAGATLAKSNADAVAKADVVFCINAPDAKDIAAMKKGAVVIGALAPFSFKDTAEPFKKAGVTAIAMELMPRITRAQNMDILSSQSNLAGYQAVIQAAAHYNRAMPMMMTAAGTIAPAKVFIMGVGVAGLQAIATAKRLGAVVSATDVRAATKEQVESLGGKFVMVEDEESKAAETSGGYAREMSDAYKKKQAALIAETIAKQDMVITTALIPGRPAPVLVTEDMVKSMKPGSVIVDLAAPMGGNCPLTEADKVVVKHGVTIIGHTNLAGQLSADASALFARNLLNFITLVYDADKKKIDLSKDAEISNAVMLMENGKPVHDILTGGTTKPAPKKKSAPKNATSKTTAKKTTTKKPAAKKKTVKKKETKK
jgi:NAD(P) transhydrogenase subunit alpha